MPRLCQGVPGVQAGTAHQEWPPSGRPTHVRTRALGPTWESPETRLTSPTSNSPNFPPEGCPHRASLCGKQSGTAQIKTFSKVQKPC